MHSMIKILVIGAGFLAYGCGTQGAPSLLASVPATPVSSVSGSGSGSSSSSRIAQLGWLSGEWLSQQGEATTEMHYSTPMAGTMLGFLRMTVGQQVTFYEFETIVEGADGLVLSPSPNGIPGVAFHLTQAGTGSAVFENPANAFPEKIVFSVVGRELHLQVSGTQNGQPVSQALVAAKS